MTDYVPRIVDAQLTRALASSGAVLLEGARATGKTRTAAEFAASQLHLDATDSEAQLARTEPQLALPGATPRLLDEYQMVPGLWNEVRHEVDRRGERGQFILTGSATPDSDPLRHSGAGRFRHILMHTMTFAETGHSTAEVSLRSLFTADQVPLARSQVDLHEVVQRIVRGGWPGWYDLDEEEAQEQARSYIADIAQHDVVDVAGRNRNARRLMAFFTAFAGLVAQPASYAAMRRRMQAEDNLDYGERAPGVMLDLATRMFICEDQPAWAPRLRSRTALIQLPSRHFVDPSLSAALLRAGSARLLSEMETLGYLFESQVVHDLRVYAQAMGARGVFHYRDSKARDEMDAVVEDGEGNWIGVEVKLGEAQVDGAAANLLRVSKRIAKQSAALVVITPTGIAHRRRDGVYAIPLTTLGA